MKTINTKKKSLPTSYWTKREEKVCFSMNVKKGIWKWFTLVELIIVITILAILATIAFISFKNYSWNARDGNRIATVKNLQSGLDLYQIKVWNYPFPDGDQILTGTINDQPLAYKWEIGNNIVSQIKFSKLPSDPEESNQKYVYGITSNKQQYQIWTVLENPVSYEPYFITPTYANTNSYKAKVEWNYKWYILFLSWGTTWIANIPSLIYNFTGTLSGSGIDLLNQAQTYYSVNTWNNLPYQLKNAKNINQEESDQVLKNKTWNTEAKLVTLSKEELLTYFNSEEETPTLTTWITSGELLWSFWVNNKESLEILVTWNASPLTPPAPTTVNGTCGSANKIYEHTDTTYWTGTFCESGISNPATPVFPTEWTPTTWTCEWSGTPTWTTANCTANKASSLTSVSQTQCTSAWWAWISEANDVYIWDTRWNWFCISPTIDIWDLAGQWISWNGWGNLSSNINYNGWNTDTWASTIRDSDVPGTSYPWQTRNLVNVVDNSTVYSCTAIWSATVWFRNASGQDDQTWQDTLENRMRYLAYYRTDAIKLSAINWISSNAKPADHLVYPALYLSDCIDGSKDLWNDMIYTHKDNIPQTITYAQYSTQQSSTAWDGRSTEAYQNRQKYLLWWTQKKGSHLPSAYSYIDSGTVWWTNWNYKWEYQVACEWNQNIAWTNDQNLSEWIWLASIGHTGGSYWGQYARMVGLYGCASQSFSYTGYRDSSMSARFVVR